MGAVFGDNCDGERTRFLLNPISPLGATLLSSNRDQQALPRLLIMTMFIFLLFKLEIYVFYVLFF